MSAEEFADEDAEDDIKDPAFVLRNLDIAGVDCFADKSNMNAARIAAAAIITQQICFYVSCVLHGYKNRQIPAAPSILIYGGGFIGKRVIEGLVDNKCGPMLYVYSRGDLKAKYWRSTGLKASPSLSRLLKDNKADVVIILSGMSSFQNLTKQLIPHMTRTTCIIASSLGLERKRFFSLFRTPALFRTYVEAPSLVDQMAKNPMMATQFGCARLDANHGVIPPNRFEPPPAAQDGAAGETKIDVSATGSPGGSPGATNVPGSPGSPDGWDDNVTALHGNSRCDSLLEEESMHGTILDSIFSFRLDPRPLLRDTVEGSVEHAADLVAQRLRRIEDMVYVLENYYAILGIPHRKARAAALYAILGYSAEGYAEMGAGIHIGEGETDEMSIGTSHDSGEGGGNMLRNILKAVKVASYPILLEGIDAMNGAIAIHFRRQFSKYIKVMDIPRCNDLEKEAKPKGAEERKKAKLARMRTTNDPSSLMGLMASATGGQFQNGEGEERDDGANEDDAEEKIHALSHGVPIHSDKMLQKIFGYDVKLTGRSATVAAKLDDWTVDADADDDTSVASAQKHYADGNASVEDNSVLTTDFTAHMPLDDDHPNTDDASPAIKFSTIEVKPLPPMQMMANPVVSQQVEDDAEMKLLMFLEDEARRKDKAARENKK